MKRCKSNYILAYLFTSMMHAVSSNVNIGESVRQLLGSDIEDGIANTRPLLDLLAHPGEKFMLYSPHDGFGNQLAAFKNALQVAAILNRTLVVPPVFQHFEVFSSDAVNGHFWNCLQNVLQNHAYVSMADYMDLSDLPPEHFRTIDFRIFLAVKCGLDVTRYFAMCAWCGPIIQLLQPYFITNLTHEHTMRRCGMILGYLPSEGQPLASNTFLLQKLCKDTAFVYQRSPEGTLTAQVNYNSHMGAKCGSKNFTYIYHQAVIRNLIGWNKAHSSQMPPVNFVTELEEAKNSSIINMGSMFYFWDVYPPSGDKRVDEISCAPECLPFTKHIRHAAQTIIKEQLQKPFACLHFRGGDGFFMNTTMDNLKKKKEELLRLHLRLCTNSSQKLDLLVMHDMPHLWKYKFKRVFGSVGFNVRYLQGHNSTMMKVLEKTQESSFGLLTNRFSKRVAASLVENLSKPIQGKVNDRHRVTDQQNMVLLIEASVCTCAKLGFIHDKFSSISRLIRLLRAENNCNV